MAQRKPGDLNNPKEKRAREELMYEWIAEYNDGTELRQFDDNLQEVYHFGHIDQDKIVNLTLISKHTPPIKISINLITGIFSFNGKEMPNINDGKNTIPLGLNLKDRDVKSSWGNKAKLIYVSHIRRDFNLGFGTMRVKILYELGWEADVDGKHQKHTIIIDSHGRLAIPPDEYIGFKPL
jgi:hypothetical protein